MQRIDELNDYGIEVEYVQVRAENGKPPYHAYVDNGENRTEAPISYFAREKGKKPISTENTSLDERIKVLEEKIDELLAMLSNSSR